MSQTRSPVRPPRPAGQVGRGRRRRRSRAGASWLPHQHGAWAMLAVPALIGVIRSRGDLVQVPLIGFWLAGYFAFNAFGVWVASRRTSVHVRPMLVYGALAAALGLIAVVWRPDLVRLAPMFVPLVAVALWCSWTRRERSMLGDVVTIVAACLFGYVVYIAGYSAGGSIAAGRASMLAITVACSAYFVGAALYVKTIIRERRSRRYRVVSIAYHVFWTVVWAAIAVQFALGPSAWDVPGISGRAALALAVFFAVLTVRAAVLAGRKLRPRDVGIGEIAASAVLFVIAAVIW